MKSKTIDGKISRLMFPFSWILNFFHAADKNQSKVLSKGECRDLLTNSLNVELPDDIFEQMFYVSIPKD